MRRSISPTLRARPGFTITELIISLVMVGILGVALTRLIVTQSRASNKQVLQRNARGVSRSALNIMLSELRAVEQSTAFQWKHSVTTAAGPPLALPLPTAITVNVPWAVGVRCTAQKVAIMPIDSISQETGRYNTLAVGYYGSDKRYVYEPLVTVTKITGDPSDSDFGTCAGATLTVSGANAMPGVRVATLSGSGLTGGTAGTPVMLFYRVEYRFDASTSVPGRKGLFRSVADANGTFGPAEELVAPFSDASGFKFFVGTNRMPSNLRPSNVETITGLQLNLLAQSENKAQGQPAYETSNYSTSIFFRNRI